MIEDIFFQDEGQVKITAASVGISRLRWTSVKQQEIATGKHLDLMRCNRFDHLPIESDSGSVSEYFQTVAPNAYDKPVRSQIKFDDIIPLDTNIRDVITKFAITNRRFFFLTYHKNISGLITVGNLNCKQVQVYIFSLICELERELGLYLNSKLNYQEIRAWVISKYDEQNPDCKYVKMIKQYDNLIERGLENQLTEEFYISDYFNILQEKKYYKDLDYSIKEWKNLNSLIDLRNLIAHPTRSLIDVNNTVERLHRRLLRIEDLIFRLNRLKTTTN